MRPYDDIEIRVCEDGEFRAAGVKAIRETPLRIVVNGTTMACLPCSGMRPGYLAAGHLYARGMIEGPEDIATLDVKETPEGIEARVTLRREVTEAYEPGATSGLGRLPWPEELVLAPLPRPLSPRLCPGDIFDLAEELHARSDLYRLTRGCHNALLRMSGGGTLFGSDIGRHNALDALVGQCLLEGLPIRGAFLMTTGRVTSEIVHKTIRAGITVLGSLSVATDMAARSARTGNLTLAGNIAGKRFWLYADPGRL